MTTKKHQNKDKSYCKYICSHCNKKYKARSSLWYHEKKCKEEEHDENHENNYNNLNINDKKEN
jgi:hypothetical protein